MVKIAVVGATGLVGRTFLAEAQRLKLPFSQVVLLASPESRGKILTVGNVRGCVRAVEEKSFEGVDIAFFCAGSKVSEIFAPVAVGSGARVVDNSSFFRTREDVPLVAVEVNFCDVGQSPLIANPNCSTLTAIPALNALKPFGLKRVEYVTFQSASGGGRRGLQALSSECDKGGMGGSGGDGFFGADLRVNCIPKIGEFCADGYTQEEIKMQKETQKILHLPHLEVSATCVRVPLQYCHAVSVSVELQEDFCLQEIFCAFKEQEGLVVEQDMPLAQKVFGKEYSVVGRIRKKGARGLNFFCVADNLRKGASSNAVLIAKKTLQREV